MVSIEWEKCRQCLQGEEIQVILQLTPLERGRVVGMKEAELLLREIGRGLNRNAAGRTRA